MRTKTEMLDLFNKIAIEDSRIRLSVVEGSLTNINIPRDKYQDYDVTYFVTEKDSYLKSDRWLEIFGKVVFMQKPEEMTLFPSELPQMYSYLMYLEDGVKIDLSLVLVEDLTWYLEESDGLVDVLVDKDNLGKDFEKATDKKYWLKEPNQAEFNDCLNEFWHVSAYVAKGLARNELLFAMDHLHNNIRQELLRMMSWYIGNQYGFDKSLGKNYKFIDQYLSENEWARFLGTFELGSIENMIKSFWLVTELFQEYSKKVSQELHFTLPNDDEVMLGFIKKYYLEKE